MLFLVPGYLKFCLLLMPKSAFGASDLHFRKNTPVWLTIGDQKMVKKCPKESKEKVLDQCGLTGRDGVRRVAKCVKMAPGIGSITPHMSRGR